MGYTTAIYLLALEALKRGKTKGFDRLRGVVVTSEPCYPFQKEVIAKAFGAPVIQEYGSVEFGVIAYEHPDGTIRVLEDRILVETIPTGREAEYEILVTDLSNFSQPLIRFAIGDRTLGPISQPTDGRGFRTIGFIEGRLMDVIQSPDGRRLHGVTLSHILNSYPQVLRYRFHQRSDASLRVELQLKGGEARNAAAEAHCRRIIEANLGPLVPVEFVYVKDFPPSTSGKFQWIISEYRSAEAPVADQGISD
jgi:phenylacetate-CoA ligase